MTVDPSVPPEFNQPETQPPSTTWGAVRRQLSRGATITGGLLGLCALTVGSAQAYQSFHHSSVGTRLLGNPAVQWQGGAFPVAPTKVDVRRWTLVPSMVTVTAADLAKAQGATGMSLPTDPTQVGMDTVAGRGPDGQVLNASVLREQGVTVLVAGGATRLGQAGLRGPVAVAAGEQLLAALHVPASRYLVQFRPGQDGVVFEPLLAGHPFPGGLQWGGVATFHPNGSVASLRLSLADAQPAPLAMSVGTAQDAWHAYSHSTDAMPGSYVHATITTGVTQAHGGAAPVVGPVWEFTPKPGSGVFTAAVSTEPGPVRFGEVVPTGGVPQ